MAFTGHGGILSVSPVLFLSRERLFYILVERSKLNRWV